MTRASATHAATILCSRGQLATPSIENDSFPLLLTTTQEPRCLGSGTLSTGAFSLLGLWGSGEDTLGVSTKGSSGPGTAAGSSSSLWRSSGCTPLGDFALLKGCFVRLEGFFALLKGFFAVLEGFFGLEDRGGGFSMIITAALSKYLDWSENDSNTLEEL